MMRVFSLHLEEPKLLSAVETKYRRAMK